MRLTWIALALLATPAFAVEEWTLKRLDIDLRVTAKPPSITMRGKATVQLEAEQSNGPTFGINARKKVMKLTRLSADGATASVRPFDDESPMDAAELRLPRAFKRGDTLDVEFEAVGVEQSSQFIWTSRLAYGSWVEHWYPVPAKGATELSPSAAPGTTTFHIPESWRSVGNGKLQSRTVSGNEATEIWSTEAATARSFVTAPFSSVEIIDSHHRQIGAYLLKARPHIRAQTEILARAIDAMEARFGPYPYDSYNIVEVGASPAFTASSEQGFIVVTSPMLGAPEGNLPLFAHEAAHGWWGNLVRNDGPGGRMLSEALAQYGAVISIEAIEGPAAAAQFLRYSRANYSKHQCARGYFNIWREGGDRPLAELGSAKWDHHLSDSKGMWFYRMLRDQIGDEKFFGALRTILRDYAGKEITLADFRRIMIAAGSTPEFLSQWLDRAGAPVPRVDWRSEDGGRKAVVQIEQLQSTPFQLPLEILVQTDSGASVRATAQLRERKETIIVETPSRPVAVILDPDDRVLIWRPEYGSRPN